MQPASPTSLADRREIRALNEVARRLWARQVLLGSLGVRSSSLFDGAERPAFGLLSKLPPRPPCYHGNRILRSEAARSCFWLVGSRVFWRVCRGQYRELGGRMFDSRVDPQAEGLWWYSRTYADPCLASRLPADTRKELLAALLAYEASGKIADHGPDGELGAVLDRTIP